MYPAKPLPNSLQFAQPGKNIQAKFLLLIIGAVWCGDAEIWTKQTQALDRKSRFERSKIKSIFVMRLQAAVRLHSN